MSFYEDSNDGQEISQCMYSGTLKMHINIYMYYATKKSASFLYFNTFLMHNIGVVFDRR